jgi:hypothetical protein
VLYSRIAAAQGQTHLNGADRRRGRRAERAAPAGSARPSRLAAFIVALSLIVQLIAAPYHQARAGDGLPGSDMTRIAAELKATFGDAAALCVEVDDKGAPLAPAGKCDDQCPLCRFVSQASGLIAPTAPALPERLDAACRALGIAPEPGDIPAYSSQTNRARAPPFAV